MKKIYLILILGVIFVSACAKEKNVLKSIENLNDEQLDQGIYYEYNYNDEELKGSEINVGLILDNLIENNIQITEAWHKSFASSCCPPDTNRCMQAIVNPVFIIKLAEETELDDFIRVDEPKIGFCAYTITHYEIE